jgi:hypothetical protein
MQFKNINWLGLVSGLLLLAVIPLSLYAPWWQLRIGDFGYANLSPLNSSFSLLDITFMIPFLTAINVSCLLLLSLSAVFMIAYSVNPNKEYSKPLLYWSYKNPLAILIVFLVALVALSQIAPFIVHQYAQIAFTLPIMGTSIIQAPSELLGGLSGVQINIAISGAFQWTFYLAIVASVLCTATRILYSKAPFIVKPAADATVTSS